MPDERTIPRVPPHSEEAEQSVLGSMLMDQDAAALAAEHLRAEDFYNQRHSEIFAALYDLHAEGREADLVTLKSQLEKRGSLEAAGDMKYLTQIAAAVPNSAHIRQYIKIVKDNALYRRYIRLGNQILEDGFSTGATIEELSNKVEAGVFKILQDRGSSDFVHIKDILMESFDDIEKAAANGGELVGIPTGFVDLDKKTAGLHPSDLILVGARPSMGKTAFGLNIIQNIAVRKKLSCAIFSLEMSRKQIVNRLLACQAGVNMENLRSGQLEDRDWEKLVEAVGVLADSPIYIDDTGGINLGDLRSKCRKLKIERGLDVIMIDYLQLMSGGERASDNRQAEIAAISRGLKALARELDVPIIALSQLSRALEARADHRPMMSDLRESGAIEQDADIIMFLYRDEYYHPDTEEKNIAEVIIGKQRNGPTGTIKLRYDGPYTRFSNLMNG